MAPKAFLGEFEQMVLLAILQKGSQAFGLEVRRELEHCTGRTVSRGAFYTTLDRLEAKGYLTWESKPVGGYRGGPQRHFTVSEAGLKALRTSRSALFKLWRGLDKILEES